MPPGLRQIWRSNRSSGYTGSPPKAPQGTLRGTPVATLDGPSPQYLASHAVVSKCPPARRCMSLRLDPLLRVSRPGQFPMRRGSNVPLTDQSPALRVCAGAAQSILRVCSASHHHTGARAVQWKLAGMRCHCIILSGTKTTPGRTQSARQIGGNWIAYESCLFIEFLRPRRNVFVARPATETITRVDSIWSSFRGTGPQHEPISTIILHHHGAG